MPTASPDAFFRGNGPRYTIVEHRLPLLEPAQQTDGPLALEDPPQKDVNELLGTQLFRHPHEFV
jgi:hypothetical protein